MIGVIGGMGVYAGTDLVDKISASTVASSDQDHVPIVLLSDPRIPDRSNFLLSDLTDDANPGELVDELIGRLETVGCTVCAVACNTFHAGAIWESLRMRTGIRILNIVDETVRTLADNRDVVGSVAVLGTVATMQFGLYSAALAESDIPRVTLSETATSKVSEAIRNVPDGLKQQALRPTDYASLLVIDAIDEAVRFGAQTVLLGCTELPLILRNEVARRELAARKISLVDPTTQLARALIRTFAPEKLRDAAWNENVLL